MSSVSSLFKRLCLGRRYWT